MHVSAHPSAQFRVRARQGRAGLGLRNWEKSYLHIKRNIIILTIIKGNIIILTLK